MATTVPHFSADFSSSYYVLVLTDIQGLRLQYAQTVDNDKLYLLIPNLGADLFL